MSNDGCIDYSTYTEAELTEALSTVDQLKFPTNHARIVERLQSIRASKPKRPIDSTSPPALVPIHVISAYRPNVIPLPTRIVNLASSLFLLVYGVIGLLLDDIYVPGRRSEGMHFHGYAAVAMFCAMFAATAVMVSTVIDHYDKRPNERVYGKFAKRSNFVAWTFFIFAALVEILLNSKP